MLNRSSQTIITEADLIVGSSNTLCCGCVGCPHIESDLSRFICMCLYCWCLVCVICCLSPARYTVTGSTSPSNKTALFWSDALSSERVSRLSLTTSTQTPVWRSRSDFWCKDSWGVSLVSRGHGWCQADSITEVRGNFVVIATVFSTWLRWMSVGNRKQTATS